VKNILYIADGPRSGGGDAGSAPKPPKPGTIEDLKQILALRDAKIAELTATQAANVEIEKRIAVKISLGLTRAQAQAAIRHQDDYDKSDHGKAVAARHARQQRKRRPHPQNNVTNPQQNNLETDY
jgi:hypothetical protein